MPRTIDHIVDTHRIARERVSAGKPAWKYTLNATRAADAPFEENRDRFARALRRSRWFTEATTDGQDVDTELFVLWEEIRDADDVKHFDQVLESIYDLADTDRCFIRFITA